MRIIKTRQDFDVLNRVGTFPVALLENVEGYIVVLESGDNVRDLGNVGLNRESGGLLGSCPEYVEPLDLGEGLHSYKVAVLYDNEYLMTFFTLAGAHDEEVESGKKLTANELVLQKLKETFDRNENITADSGGTNVWVMFATLKPFSHHLGQHLPYPLSGRKPTHCVRRPLRNSTCSFEFSQIQAFDNSRAI
ncbi:hypothetical protein [Paenibacillus lautus]|jgi:hypothetical protein|uniref:hypothetical protein n=1 Tax=Paenibacillus lautus TaxID=1401 RepID=UPI000FDC2A46|nr:hypothetical protein [Paenibacillus lautus]